jgi:hypothetical protein
MLKLNAYLSNHVHLKQNYIQILRTSALRQLNKRKFKIGHRFVSTEEHGLILQDLHQHHAKVVHARHNAMSLARAMHQKAVKRRLLKQDETQKNSKIAQRKRRFFWNPKHNWQMFGYRGLHKPEEMKGEGIPMSAIQAYAADYNLEKQAELAVAHSERLRTGFLYDMLNRLSLQGDSAQAHARASLVSHFSSKSKTKSPSSTK